MAEESRKSLRLGVMGCSEFAGRAMLPAMRETPGMELRVVASRSLAKARSFGARFGIDAAAGYDELLRRDDIDAVYIPLPPGLHAEWVERSLAAGKHVLVEKPFTVDAPSAARLVAQARQQGLLIMENVLFPHHSQSAWVREQLASDVLGPVRLFRSTFTIPPLAPDNFRYQASLGGGALLDLGPYVTRFAKMFLGPGATLLDAAICEDAQRGVDTSGIATFANEARQVAQVAYGFDTQYQCAWEFLGTRAKLVVDRAYTAPPGFAPVVRIERQNHCETRTLPADNHYRKMCDCFTDCVLRGLSFEPHWNDAEGYSQCLEDIRTRAVRL